jgi:hypothetical protein
MAYTYVCKQNFVILTLTTITTEKKNPGIAYECHYWVNSDLQGAAS